MPKQGKRSAVWGLLIVGPTVVFNIKTKYFGAAVKVCRKAKSKVAACQKVKVTLSPWHICSVDGNIRVVEVLFDTGEGSKQDQIRLLLIIVKTLQYVGFVHVTAPDYYGPQYTKRIQNAPYISVQTATR